MIINQPFYAEGLCFSCTRCSACCRHESGFVFLSANDVSRLAVECRMSHAEFIDSYCRWVPSNKWFSPDPSGNEVERLSLKEKSDFDCIFWDSGCKVYNSRPLQCSAFPFWPSVLDYKKSWERVKMDCPGMDQGKRHDRVEIEALLKLQSEESIVTREAQIPRG